MKSSEIVKYAKQTLCGLVVAAVATLSGCTTVPDVPENYKIPQTSSAQLITFVLLKHENEEDAQELEEKVVRPQYETGNGYTHLLHELAGKKELIEQLAAIDQVVQLQYQQDKINDALKPISTYLDQRNKLIAKWGALSYSEFDSEEFSICLRYNIGIIYFENLPNSFFESVDEEVEAVLERGRQYLKEYNKMKEKLSYELLDAPSEEDKHKIWEEGQKRIIELTVNCREKLYRGALTGTILKGRNQFMKKAIIDLLNIQEGEKRRYLCVTGCAHCEVPAYFGKDPRVSVQELAEVGELERKIIDNPRDEFTPTEKKLQANCIWFKLEIEQLIYDIRSYEIIDMSKIKKNN